MSSKMPNTLKRKRAAKAPPAAVIPEPFEPAPPELAPLLATFDLESVYITHLDKHPAWFKRRIYYIPVVINVTIGLLLLWRIYAAYPLYWSLLMSVMGNPNETTVYYSKTPWGELVRTVSWRAAVFVFDYFIFSIVGPWPWSFFFETPGNPVIWRYTIGFRNEEIYVRKSRGWGSADLLGEAEGSSGKAGGDSPFFKTRILPAVDQRRLREKTGYLLMDKDFDLDFGAMVTATRLLDKKDVSLDLLRTGVFVWVGGEESGQWAVWNCGKLDKGSRTEARKKIVQFKERLTAMGKESLFFKWVELIQFESNAPGGFTYERQVETTTKARKLFEDEGVDFNKFIQDIGGLEGMPGMD